MRSLVFLICFGTAVSLGANAPGNERDSRALVSDAQVNRWAKVWQKRLSLEDWDIGVRVVRIWELKPETLGNLHWNSNTRLATIRVLSPADYDIPASEIPEDMEFTIVHELVHLHLAALPHDPRTKTTEESVVNKLAEALLRLDRGPAYEPRITTAKDIKTARPASEASRSRGDH